MTVSEAVAHLTTRTTAISSRSSWTKQDVEAVDAVMGHIHNAPNSKHDFETWVSRFSRG